MATANPMSSYRRYKGGRPRNNGKRLISAFLVLVLACVLLFAALECVVYSGAKTQVTGEPDVMVIFGCQVMSYGPSVLLKDRLDTALDYLEEHPDLTIIVSGGQGTNEPVTEALAMHDYLVEHGVDSQQIIMEEQATNTWETVKYVFDMFKSGVFETSGNILIVSSDFHLTRIQMLWNRGWEGDTTLSTLAAPCSHFPSRARMFVREPLALVKSFLFDRR